MQEETQPNQPNQQSAPFNKNMAKKTGKSSTPTSPEQNASVNTPNVSSSTPNSKQFMNEYEQILQKNIQNDWLNSNNHQFIAPKEQETKPKTSSAQLPSFWKKTESKEEELANSDNQADTPQHQTRSQYKQRLAKARLNFIQQSQAIDAAKYKDLQTTDPNNKKDSLNTHSQKPVGNNTPKTKQASINTPTQQQKVPDSNQPLIVEQTTTKPANNNYQAKPPPLPNNLFSKNIAAFNITANQQAKVGNQQNSALNKPTQTTTVFNKAPNAPNFIQNNNNNIFTNNFSSNNNNNNVFPPKTNLIFQNNYVQPQFNNNMQPQFNNNMQPQTNANFTPDFSKAGYRRETWSCALPYASHQGWVKYRNQLGNTFKNKPNFDDKMLDMLAVITFSEKHSMPIAEIQEKRASIKTLALSLEEAKQNQNQFIVTQNNSVEDRRMIGFRLQDFVKKYQEMPRITKYNSQQQVKQLLDDQDILKKYQEFQNMTLGQFIKLYQKFYETSCSQYEKLRVRIFQLIQKRKTIETQLAKLRQQKKQGKVSDLFIEIEQRQQNILALLYKLVDRLDTDFDNLPKSDLNYELEEIRKLQLIQQDLMNQLKCCNEQLTKAKSGHPYKQLTDLLCQCTSYLAQRVENIQTDIVEIQQQND